MDRLFRNSNRFFVLPTSRQNAVLGYIIAPLLVVGITWMLRGVQDAVSFQANDHYLRPYGIAYIIPVILATTLAGWPCGLTTLLISIGACDLYLMGHPAWNSQLSAPEITELTFLGTVGLIVLVAVAALMRNVQLFQELNAVNEQRQTFFRDVLVNVTDGKLNLVTSANGLPAALQDSREEIGLSQQNLCEFRHLVGRAADSVHLPADRKDDLVTAAGEAGMNAIVHAGGGTGTVTTDGDHTVQVRIEDHGRGIALEHLPRATFEKGYTTAGTMGFGMKMMLTAADRVWLLTGPAGTTVVVQQQTVAPPPAWLARTYEEMKPVEA